MIDVQFESLLFLISLKGTRELICRMEESILMAFQILPKTRLNFYPGIPPGSEREASGTLLTSFHSLF